MIAIVDYGAGNLGSVANALDRLGVSFTMAGTPAALDEARGIIFPGVGAAAPAMRGLRERRMDIAIVEAIATGMPFLGICLGLQLLFESSTEDGAVCLGVLRGTVERLATPEKLPHVGWNTVHAVRPHPVLAELDGEPMYFVHSFVVAPKARDLVLAETVYGVPFVSAVARDHLIGVQFHPERSGSAGLRLLQNFVRIALQQSPPVRGVEEGAASASPSSSPLPSGEG